LFRGIELVDKAERLQNLCSALLGNAMAIIPHVATHQSVLVWQVIEDITQSLQYSSFAALQNNLRGLCEDIKVEISHLPLRKLSVRTGWMECLDLVADTFEAKHFGARAEPHFQRHFSATNLAILEAISLRLQSEGIVESDESEIDDAVEAVQAAAEAVMGAGVLDVEAMARIDHYLKRMMAVREDYHYFGEQNFWTFFNAMFSTFVQARDAIQASPDHDLIQKKVLRVYSILVGRVGDAGDREAPPALAPKPAVTPLPSRAAQVAPAAVRPRPVQQQESPAPAAARPRPVPQQEAPVRRPVQQNTPLQQQKSAEAVFAVDSPATEGWFMRASNSNVREERERPPSQKSRWEQSIAAADKKRQPLTPRERLTKHIQRVRKLREE
jgi:uncharacterized protein YqgV (UPF0045/DUF77 family)